mgnify:CR=1 FL=1
MTVTEKLYLMDELEDRNHQHLVDFYHDQYQQAMEDYEKNPTSENLTKYLEANDRYYSQLH